MSAAKFFTDEDIYAAVAIALGKSGIDIISTPDARRCGESDESQLIWASGESRVLLTFNVSDFAGLHSEWIGLGRHHSGVVVSSQRPIGEVVRRVIRLAAALSAESFADHLEYLSDW